MDIPTSTSISLHTGSASSSARTSQLCRVVSPGGFRSRPYAQATEHQTFEVMVQTRVAGDLYWQGMLKNAGWLTPVRKVAPASLARCMDSLMRLRFPSKSRGTLGRVAAATVTKDIVRRCESNIAKAEDCKERPHKVDTVLSKITR